MTFLVFGLTDLGIEMTQPVYRRGNPVWHVIQISVSHLQLVFCSHGVAVFSLPYHNTFMISLL